MVERGRQRRSGTGGTPRSFYLGLAALAIAGVAWVGWSVLGGGAAGATAGVRGLDFPDAEALMTAAQGVDLGPADATVQVIVFSDFTCPACKVFNERVEPGLKAELIPAGRVRLTYHDYPLDLRAARNDGHRHGFVAARAARCAAEQDAFWPYHDLLFQRQQAWALRASAPADAFNDYAEELALDTEAFAGCLASDRHADVVTANRVLGDSVGVGSTPTVLVAGKPLAEWSSYEALKEMVEAELARR